MKWIMNLGLQELEDLFSRRPTLTFIRFYVSAVFTDFTNSKSKQLTFSQFQD